jgi:hypothetical protein
MATESEAGGGVVGNQLLGFGWRGEFGSAFHGWYAAQQVEWRVGLVGAGGKPGGLPPMASELGQGAGSGEQCEILVVQLCACREISNAV